MAKNNEIYDEEFIEEESNCTLVVEEKKGFLTKAKEKISAIGDITLKDAAKGIGKGIGIVAGGALLIVGAKKLLNSNDDDIEIIDLDGFDDLDVFDATEQETTEE